MGLTRQTAAIKIRLRPIHFNLQRQGTTAIFLEFDVSLFYWVNTHLQNRLMKSFMMFMTSERSLLIPAVLVIPAIVWFKGKRGLAFLVMAVLLVALNDSITSQILKPFFARSRPCHDLAGLIDFGRCGSSFSFPSNHASNIFTAATFCGLVFRNALPIVYTVALLVGYSRVYLGVHYPADVLAGAATGILIGILGYKLYKKLLPAAAPRRGSGDPARKKFLIVKLSSLGDVVHTLPVSRTLRENYPHAFIAWVVEERVQDVLRGNPDVDELIVVRTKYWRRRWNLETFREIGAIFRRIRGLSFDYVFDFQGLLKSGVIAFLSGAPNRIGFHRRDCREFLNTLFINRKAPYIGKKTHVVDKNLFLLKAVGIQRFHKQFPINIPPHDVIENFFEDNPELSQNPIVAINPGVGFKTKQWKLRRFAELADRIAGELECHILFTWGPGEKEKIDFIGSQMTQRFWVAPPTTVAQSATLYRRLQLFVGCDTGPLHLCAALGIPTVSLFGPTDPARNGPFGNGHQVVYNTLPCSFCYKRKCPTHNECMEEIQVESVFAPVKKIIRDRENIVASNL